MSEESFDAQRIAWHKAWAAAWAKMPDIKQGRKATIPTKSGTSFSYTYAGLPDIIESVRAVLAAEGLAVSQSVEHLADDLLGVTTRIYHKDGWVESFGPTPMAATGDPRTIGSAITYARRYALAAALGVASDEDTDAGGTEGTARKARTPATATTRPPTATEPPAVDRYTAHKKAALEAIVAAYPAVEAGEAKRLAAKHWAEALDVAGDGAEPGLVAEVLLGLVKDDPECPF